MLRLVLAVSCYCIWAVDVHDGEEEECSRHPIDGTPAVVLGGRRLSDPPGTLEVRVAGTLGLTGKYATTSAHAYRGLQLLIARVNSEGVFAGYPNAFQHANGSAIRMKVTIEDDQSSVSKVKSLYENMMAVRTADLYLAPYSSGLSLAAAKVTNASGQIIMTHGAATRSIYTDHKFTHVFSTNVMADNYLQNGLELLRDRGAVTLVAAWENGLFNEAVCLGAVKHARALGYDILGNFSFGPVDLTTHIRETSVLGPDVFVGCGHLTHAINTVVTSRALGFSPKAMMITQSTTGPFIQAVGAPNANYLLGPVAWHEEMADSKTCPYFGSGVAFTAKFREMFKKDPTYHSAQLAAGGIALMAAVAKLGKAGPPKDIRRTLLELDTMTFYGRMKFAGNGIIAGKLCATLQVQPMPESEGREDRYTQSAIEYVGNRAGEVFRPPMYEMPTWEQKELEVFPCDPGYVVNQSNIEAVSCEACAIGRYRPRSSLACGDCGLNFYSDQEGLAQCILCPAGADCGPNKGVGQPYAKDGYYKLPHKFLYEQCDPPELCLGNNECSGSNAGVMCGQCRPGYTTQGGFDSNRKVCTKCPSKAANGAHIFLLLLFFSAYIGVIGYLTLASGSSIRSIHSIILKKVVNHMQLASTAWTACNFNNEIDFSMVSAVTQDPTLTFISLDCLLEGYDVKLHTARGIMGLGLIPLVLLCNFLFFFCILLWKLRAFNKLSKKHYRIDSARTEVAPEALGKDKKEEQEKVKADAQGQDATDVESSSSEEEQDVVVEYRPNLMAKWHAIQDIMIACKQWSIVWLFILHPIVVKMVLDGVTCVELDVMRLTLDLDTICKSAQHEVWFWLSTAGLIIYGLGIPLATWIVLFHNRHRLMHLTVRKTYGFLYNGFEAHWYYFEVIYMLRKVAILLCAAVIPVMYVRVVAMLCLSFVFLALHIYCNPYDNRDYFVLDKMETTSLLSLIFTLQLRLFINVRTEIKDSSPFVYVIVSHPIFDWTLRIGCWACYLWFWVLALQSLFRNSVMKVLHLKAECAPERLTDVQRLLLLAEPNMHRLKLKRDTHELDISGLSQKERHFLFTALCDTMECYINTDHHFHPGRIVTAVRRAMALCVKDRAARAHILLHIMDRSKAFTGWFKAPKRWYHEITNAVSTGKKKMQVPTGRSIQDIIRRRQLASAKKNAPTENSATVEELQNALMLCWPEIIEHRPRFFVLEKPPAEVAKANAHNEKVAQKKRYEEETDDDDDDASAPELDTEETTGMKKVPRAEMEDALRQAVEPIDISTVALRKRHTVVSQEVWLLRAEIDALHEHLGELAGTDQESADTWTGTMASLDKDDSVECTHIHELARRLRALQREADAVEMIALTARLLRIRHAWVKSQTLDEDITQTRPISVVREEPDPSVSDEDLEARIVSSLYHGDHSIRHVAAKLVSDLRVLAQNLRDLGSEVEGNMMEALGLKLGHGVLPEELLHHQTKDNTDSHARTALSSEGSPGELMRLEIKVNEFTAHLYDLHQASDAKTVDLMANRLLALRQHLLKNMDPAALLRPRSSTEEANDSGWQGMGALAQHVVAECAEVAKRLQANGLDEEAVSLNTLVEALAHGLMRDTAVLI